MIWIFFDESKIIENYSIDKSGYLFYFLFAVIIIPFQLLIDILFFNLSIHYHHIDFLDYLNHLKERYKNRTKIWKSFDDDESLQVNDANRSLDHWCYSSQYYFTMTLVLTSSQFVLMGAQTIKENNYNLFEDYLVLVFLISFWIIACYLF